MAAPEEWSFTVPEDDAELVAELRRHGVKPGQRLHVTTMTPTPGEAPEPAKRRRFGLIGVVKDAPTDVSTRTDEYLEGFGLD